MRTRETSSGITHPGGGGPAIAGTPLPRCGVLARAERKAGFTLVELALVIAILGILAGVAAPRFSALRSFEEPFFAQDVLSSLRYAQKLAGASGARVVEMANQVGAREGVEGYLAMTEWNVRVLSNAFGR